MPGKKIQIFDDSLDLLELCTLVLEEKGYQVLTSATSNNIVEQVSAFMPDVIFMDNWLPDVNGIIATKRIKSCEALKHIPVIDLTANNNVMELAAQAAANDYLAKPFDISDLENIAKKYLNI